MRILVTGSRSISERDRVVVSMVLRAFISTTHQRNYFIVGDCPTGVDRIATENSICPVVYKADWDTHGKAAGPLRNQQMVDSGADLCLAFPGPKSKGTRDCMRRAKAAGIPVLVMELEGLAE